MKSAREEKIKVSSYYRASEIALGIVALAVSFLALFFPAGFIVTLVVLFGMGLMFIGIFSLASVVSPKGVSDRTRKINAIIGVSAVIIAAITLVFPGLATAVLVVLIGLGMLVFGVGRIITGVTARQPKVRFKVLFVLSGGVVVIFSIVTMFSPIFGVYIYAYFISITFMLIGVISLVSGIIGAPL